MDSFNSMICIIQRGIPTKDQRFQIFAGNINSKLKVAVAGEGEQTFQRRSEEKKTKEKHICLFQKAIFYSKKPFPLSKVVSYHILHRCMDKLWTDQHEKNYYSKVYQKMINSKKTLPCYSVLSRLLLNRAGLTEASAAMILEKCFKISKDEEKMDQTGFFYLMKYISYVQLGGDANDDITEIQKELPKPDLHRNTQGTKNKRRTNQKNRKNSINSNPSSSSYSCSSLEEDGSQDQRQNEVINNNDKKVIQVRERSRIMTFGQTDPEAQEIMLLLQQNSATSQYCCNNNKDQITISNSSKLIGCDEGSTIKKDCCQINLQNQEQEMKIRLPQTESHSLLGNISIKIVNYSLESDSIFSRTYILYSLETYTNDQIQWQVKRRYNNFKALDRYFNDSSQYQGVIIPLLPSQNMTSIGSYLGANMLDVETIEQRKIDLECYMNALIKNQILNKDRILRRFLEEPNGFQEKIEEDHIQDRLRIVNDTDRYLEAYTFREALEIDSTQIDEKIGQLIQTGSQCDRLIELMSENIKFDSDISQSIDRMEERYYSIDQQQQQESSIKNDQYQLQLDKGMNDGIKKMKRHIVDQKRITQQQEQNKKQIVNEMKFMNTLVQSAMNARGVLKKKINEYEELKNEKINKEIIIRLKKDSNNDLDGSDWNYSNQKRDDRKDYLINEQQELKDLIGLLVKCQQTTLVIKDRLEKELTGLLEQQTTLISEFVKRFTYQQIKEMS